MWNYPADPDSYCLKLHANGIRNIFIETSRSNTEAVSNPVGLGSLLEAAHRYKMRVIAWSFAELANPTADADKLVAVACFVSPRKEKVDAVASNLEKDLAASKVTIYSQRLRDSLGPNYPMIAVVYSPLNHAPPVASIPWKLIDKYFNVIAPMNYWNSKYERIEPFDYTLKTIKRIRQLVGRPDVEVHMIGDGMGTHGDSIKQFLTACRTGAATSASLYPNQKITDEQLGCLSQYPEYFAVNSRFRLASYRELLRRGVFAALDASDPSDSIPRGEFYCSVLRQVCPNALAAEAVATEKSQVDEACAAGPANPSDCLCASRLWPYALAILTKVGVVKIDNNNALGQASFLSEAISTKEALDTIASLVEVRERLKHSLAEGKRGKQQRLLSNISRKAERLFVQPAFAEANRGSLSGPPLSYLDAAQILVQASAGLK